MTIQSSEGPRKTLFVFQYNDHGLGRGLEILPKAKLLVSEELYDVSSSVESNFLELSMFLLIHLKLKGLKTFNIVQNVFVQCFLICKQNVTAIWKVSLQTCE